MFVWTPANAGNDLKLIFTAPESGDDTLELSCVLFPGGDRFGAKIDEGDVSFDGKDSVTLEAPYHIQSRVVGTQVKELQAGNHELTVTATEADRPIGLDFLGLQKH